MSIQNEYDLILIGNIVIDNIYYIDSDIKEGTSNILLSNKISIGGIGNIVNILLNKKLTLFVNSILGNDENSNIIKDYFNINSVDANFKISNNQTSNALIISNLKSNERTSFVNWGNGDELYSVPNIKSKWIHISYLDICSKLNIQNIKNNIISADLCLSNPSIKIVKLVKKQLQYLNYLFISETEIIPLIGSDNIFDIQDFINKYKLECLIFHRKNKTMIFDNGIYQETNIQPLIQGVDVLGAGDIYCANFIYYMLNNTQPNKINAADFAHKQTSEFLLNRSYEKV
jgi:sugar/nucleoside kinase (ribokinase family)